MLMSKSVPAKEPDFKNYNMHTYERVLRVLLGGGMIVSVLFVPAPFNYLVLLPLVGIYPCLTGVIGWDPLYYLANFNALEIDHYPATDAEQQGPDSFSYLTPRYV